MGMTFNGFSQAGISLVAPIAVIGSSNFNDNNIAIYSNGNNIVFLFNSNFSGNTIRFKFEGGILCHGGAGGTDKADMTTYGGQIFNAPVVKTPTAATWIPFAGTYSLPAGGTWAYVRFSSFTAAPVTGVAAGGTAIGAANTAGFAWQIAA
jgi:hypothetical protein